MRLEEIREKTIKGEYAVDEHALTEGLKDGILIEDMLFAILHGKIIEAYPERNRCLIFVKLPSGLPLHVVVEYGCPDELNIVTAYIPEERKWIKSTLRKKRNRKQ